MDDGLCADNVSLVGGAAACSVLEDYLARDHQQEDLAGLKPDDSASQVGSDDPGGQPVKTRIVGGARMPAAKAKGKGKGGKGKAKGKGKGKGTTSPDLSCEAPCELCEVVFLLVDFPPNANKCYECKRDWDSLGRLCKRQGHDEWWKALASKKPAEKRKVARSFRKEFRACLNVQDKQSFKLLEFCEGFKCVSATDLVQNGKKMWLEEAIEHCMSVPGGSHSRSEAEACLDTAGGRS